MRVLIKYLKKKIIAVSNRIKLAFMNHRELNNAYDFDGRKWISDRTKIVVFTCITGGYDTLTRPIFLDGIDYVVFSDKKVEDPFWSYTRIPGALDGCDNLVKNRYVKFHPFIFADKYDYALYIDGNIQVLGDVRKTFFATANNKTGLAMHRHQFRDCVYKEFKACKIYKKGNLKRMIEQINRYRAEGFPKRFGLYECNVIAVDLHNKNAKKIMDTWWEEFLRSGSMRDQIALPYVIWKLGYKFDDVGSLGNNVYRNPLFKKREHIKGGK